MGEVGKRSPFQVDSGGVLMYCIDNRDSMSASSINLKTNTRISLERMPNRSHCRTNSTREDEILTIIVLSYVLHHPGRAEFVSKESCDPLNRKVYTAISIPYIRSAYIEQGTNEWDSVIERLVFKLLVFVQTQLGRFCFLKSSNMDASQRMSLNDDIVRLVFRMVRSLHYPSALSMLFLSKSVKRWSVQQKARKEFV